MPSLLTALAVVSLAGLATQDPEAVAVEGRANASASDQASGSEPTTTERGEQRGFYLDDGLWLSLLRDRLRVRFGGEVQLDGVTYAKAPDDDSLRADLAFRRARLDVRGTFRTRWRFRFRADAVNNDPPTWKDAYIEFTLPRLGSYIRTGRFSSRFGLEKGGSSNDFVFMEQSLPNAFVPPQETGILLHRVGPEGSWDIGFTSATSDLSSCLACDVQGLVARFSHGFQLGSGTNLIHAGINVAGRRPADGLASYRSRPESFLSPFLVDTGILAAKRVTVLVFEAAYRAGPLLLQGEFGASQVTLRESEQKPWFNGLYVLAAYTLTGEQRDYRFGSGSFRRPRPRRPLGSGDGGFGAVEIAVRLSQLDLDDKGISGGRLRDLTLGLNWYARDRFRLAINAIRANRRGVDPVWILQARLQFAL